MTDSQVAAEDNLDRVYIVTRVMILIVILATLVLPLNL